MSCDEYLLMLPSSARKLIADIRLEKELGTRSVPSATLIDSSNLLSESTRSSLVDKVASLVDENLSGRADMCTQYADLLHRALRQLGLLARPVMGEAQYFVDGAQVFSWKHAWVRVGREVIDGNVDSLIENPMVPAVVRVRPYWGPITETPPDRRLKQNKTIPLPQDSDVDNTWWPELSAWVSQSLDPNRA